MIFYIKYNTMSKDSYCPHCNKAKTPNVDIEIYL